MGGKSRQSLSTGIVRALGDIAKVVGHHHGRAAVIGGIAVIARGVQRLTRDIDVAFAGSDMRNEALVEELGRAEIVPRIADAIAFADENQVLLMRHAKSAVDIDISRAWLPFELEALAASRPEVLGGVRIAVAQAEDLIIFKAVAWRAVDRQDVETLLALHGTRIDLERVRRHVKELGDALEVNRLRDLDELIARMAPRPTPIDAVKDLDGEHPVASQWRPTFREIVKAFVRHDYRLAGGVARVAPVSASTAKHIEDYIAEYGETLGELPDDTWKTSVSQWMGKHWQVLVDLWTLESGPSDMVLHANVFETRNGFRVEIHMVYVP